MAEEQELTERAIAEHDRKREQAEQPKEAAEEGLKKFWKDHGLPAPPVTSAAPTAE